MGSGILLKKLCLVTHASCCVCVCAVLQSAEASPLLLRVSVAIFNILVAASLVELLGTDDHSSAILSTVVGGDAGSHQFSRRPQ